MTNALERVARGERRWIESRLHRLRGERQKGHDLLAPLHGWFTEGFDMPDLKDAKGLLDALE